MEKFVSMSVAVLIIVESVHGSSENIIDVYSNLLAMDFQIIYHILIERNNCSVKRANNFFPELLHTMLLGVITVNYQRLHIYLKKISSVS